MPKWHLTWWNRDDGEDEFSMTLSPCVDGIVGNVVNELTKDPKVTDIRIRLDNDEKI